jgi:hypothetical protein
MVVDAGQEGVAARNPVHETLRHQKIERTVDGDRGWARTSTLFHDLISAERLVTCSQDFQHLAAHRRQALATRGTNLLGVRERV